MNEPAFPRDHAHDGHNGMALRDYFAAKAMPSVFDLFWSEVQGGQVGCPEGWRDGIAEDAYKMADAMLRVRAHGVKEDGK
jgi:hypothetical protein